MPDSTTDLIQYASIAGELAPNLWGRTDFQKYDSAWAELRNWFVDYRGPLLTRAGQEFGDIIPNWTAGNAVKFVTFQFSPDTADTFICVFTGLKVRFIQDNAWVLEASKAIASVANGAGNRVTVTSTAHGFSNGDYAKLGGFTNATLKKLNTRTILVANVTANTFDLADAITGVLITIASVPTNTGTASRIYTIASPYADADLPTLVAKQANDVVRLTHGSYPTKNLIRSGATSWAISNESIGSAQVSPTALGFHTTSADGRSAIYYVTAVSADGEESQPTYVRAYNIADIMGGDSKTVRLAWTAAASAVSYRIYRSVVVNDNGGALLTADATVGYIGTSYTTTFSDNGITPDFAQAPRFGYNPFANAAIQYVTDTAGGSGYSDGDTINWPTGGSGAQGILIVAGNAGGFFGFTDTGIKGIRVLWGGHDYTGTAITITSAGGGTGATLVATLSPATGNYPATSCIFQQRQWYAATTNFPLRMFGSRPGYFSNFDDSGRGLDDDFVALDLDTDEIAPIRHMIPILSALVIFTETEVWIAFAADASKALTANSGHSDMQSKVGASYATPIVFESMFLCYVANEGQDLQLLQYDAFYHRLQRQNLSILANHLFSPSLTLSNIAYALAPFKILYGVQSNGRLIACSIDQTNDVYAMSQFWTQGYYKEIAVVEESNASSLYVAVERTIQSTRCLFFERQRQRNWARLEDAFCVDAGLALGMTKPAGRLTPSSLTGAVTFTVTGATPFLIGDIGKVIRCGDGLATISGFTSSSILTGTWTRNLTETVPETTTPASYDTGNWTLDSPTAAINGLWHLIGQTVIGLADGLPVAGTVVDSMGSITLGAAASRVALGLQYTCRAKTLPPSVTNAVIEGRKKDVVGVALKVNDTYGMKYGKDLAHLTSVADRDNRLWGTAPALQNKTLNESVRANWEKDAQMYFVQDTAQPAGILAFVRDTDVGDEKA